METIDKIIGARLRELRTLKGVSRERLGEVAGISHQQIGKYEVGEDRVSAGRAYLFCQELDVPIQELYANLEGHQRGRIDRADQELLYAYIDLPQTTKLSIKHLVQSVRHDMRLDNDRHN